MHLHDALRALGRSPAPSFRHVHIAARSPTASRAVARIVPCSWRYRPRPRPVAQSSHASCALDEPAVHLHATRRAVGRRAARQRPPPLRHALRATGEVLGTPPAARLQRPWRHVRLRRQEPLLQLHATFGAIGRPRSPPDSAIRARAAALRPSARRGPRDCTIGPSHPDCTGGPSARRVSCTCTGRQEIQLHGTFRAIGRSRPSRRPPRTRPRPRLSCAPAGAPRTAPRCRPSPRSASRCRRPAGSAPRRRRPRRPARRPAPRRSGT